MAIHCQLLFFWQSSPSSPDPASLITEDISTNSNGPKPAEVVLDDDREDLFAGNYKYLYFKKKLSIIAYILLENIL